MSRVSPRVARVLFFAALPLSGYLVGCGGTTSPPHPSHDVQRVVANYPPSLQDPSTPSNGATAPTARDTLALEREKLLHQQLELERQKAEIQKQKLEQQIEAERHKSEIEREKREQLERETNARLAAERTNTFTDADLTQFKSNITNAADDMGKGLLQATHPTGTYGSTGAPLVTLSPSGDYITTQLTVRWKGAITDESYTTVYSFRITKRGFDRLEVVRDSALIKIDPQFLKSAEATLRDIFDQR